MAIPFGSKVFFPSGRGFEESGSFKMLATGLPKVIIFGPPLSAVPAWVVSYFEKSNLFCCKDFSPPTKLGREEI